MRRPAFPICLLLFALSWTCTAAFAGEENHQGDRLISRASYHNSLQGFWLGQSIANWTGLVTEMDKIGGEGVHGEFYTRADWGQPDQPNIWSEGAPSGQSDTIDWVLVDEGEAWGAESGNDRLVMVPAR